MAEVDVRAVSSATGTYRAPRPQAPVRRAAETGNTQPESGKTVPVPEVEAFDMEELARKLNLATQSIGRDLRFEVDMESGRSVIQVLDRETGEVIRQIPPEKAGQFLASNGDVQLRLFNGRV